jgi:hypothetical protein
MAIIHASLAWVRGLIKPRGRHRAEATTNTPQRSVPSPRPAPPLRRAPRPRSPYGLDKPLDGDAQWLVRPYVVAREQRQRRRILYYASFGIDLDTRMIHTGGVR